MRKLVGMAGLMSLAACSGTGPESAGSVASTGAGTQTVASTGTFVAPTETKTYKAQGGVQSYSYTYGQRVVYQKDVVLNAAGSPVLDDNGFPTRAVNKDKRTLAAAGQLLQLYQANASTVRTAGINVSYDPRNAQFTLQIAQDGVSQNITFQDPAHRTSFGGMIEPQPGVPNLQDKGVKYLEVRLSDDLNTQDEATFFYEQPGTSTKYVTYAGYVRNRVDLKPTEEAVADTTLTQVVDLKRKQLLERAAFVFGEQTDNSAVPKTGTATYSGNLLASMANNPDYENSRQTYFQWISGTQRTTVDFAAGSVGTTLAGTVGAPLLDTQLATASIVPGAAAPSVPIPEGSTFAANATGRIDLVATGGFTGQFSDARFTTPGGAVQTVKIEGSSLDGAFYGPKAEEVGASFRIVGGVPDQRVDVVGSFTGAHP